MRNNLSRPLITVITVILITLATSITHAENINDKMKKTDILVDDIDQIEADIARLEAAGAKTRAARKAKAKAEAKAAEAKAQAEADVKSNGVAEAEAAWRAVQSEPGCRPTAAVESWVHPSRRSARDVPILRGRTWPAPGSPGFYPLPQPGEYLRIAPGMHRD